MFSNEINEKTLPPNFLNSILTNPSLYEMFKNDFDANIEYFQNTKKEVYLNAMLDLIEETLFSGNLFHIYAKSDEDDINELTRGKLSYIRVFYDDFLLEEFKKDPENLLKTKLFKGLEFALKSDEYAKESEEFKNLYDYIFSLSIDYNGIVEVLLKDAIRTLSEGETLSIKDFQLLCNYVKNNVYGEVDIDIVTGMLRNHALKVNHIFDREVVEILVSSTIKSYLSEYEITPNVIFCDGLEGNLTSTRDLNTNTITIDLSLIEGFVSLNYVELFEVAFYEAEIVKSATLLKKNRCDAETLKTIMNIVSLKADVGRLFIEEDYMPSEYISDLRATSFVKALRFFSSFGINLFSNYVASKTKEIDIDFNVESEKQFSKKEISLDQRFAIAIKKLSSKEVLINKYEVLKLTFNKDGSRKETIDLIKLLNKEELKEFITDYLHSRIIEPDRMIDDVNALSSYKPKNPFIKEFIERELKYFYVDAFYYSLDSYLKLNVNAKLEIEEYLDDLLVRTNCIKDTPLTHKFIDEVIFTIDDAKQSW